MEWWLIAIIKILIINLILSGDNAIVIALASRHLPPHQQKIAVFWGALGAVTLRVVLTLIAIQLLQIPFLTALGAILLVWIAIKLITQQEEHEEIKASHTLKGAVMTIIIADFIMSLDNVLAITAVAKNDFILIFFGLVFSIPLIVWGSQLILKLLEKMPVLIYLGAAILGFTAGEMLVADAKVAYYIPHGSFWHLLMPIISTIFVLAIGWFKRIKTAYA
ncbi:TerC family protein [Caldalkalibacillus salinus]|uniref:TerC family protein n=1 Tax=Caldalkalibacillus salinus TaxID=2803787 RepID=UPI00192056A6|nr:TerC family protein [Caldalkalibacillus salinus]